MLIIGGYELKELAGTVSASRRPRTCCGAVACRPATSSTALRAEMARAAPLPADDARAWCAPPAKAPPIDALRMACATLSLDLANPNDISPAADLADAKMLTARFPTIVAAHARLRGRASSRSRRAPTCRCAANFLYMVHGKEPDPIAARALDTYWVTVIDHGMNASTFAGARHRQHALRHGERA